MSKFLDDNGLIYLWSKIKGAFVAKETGKGLSENNLTDTLKSNYDLAYTHSQSNHAPSDAEKNVQSDWSENNSSSSAYIKNKPTIPSPVTVDSAMSDSSTNPVQNKIVKAAIDAHSNSTSNPHGVTKSQVGLGNVDNVQQIAATEKGNANGVATLDENKKVPNTQLNIDTVLSGTSENMLQNKVVKLALDGKIESSTKGQPNGVAPLDSEGLIPSQHLPSFVDDVVELLTISATNPASCATGDMYYKTSDKKIYTATGTNTWGATGKTPEKSKIYVNLDTNTTYRWGGSELIQITSGDMVAITNLEIDNIVAS